MMRKTLTNLILSRRAVIAGSVAAAASRMGAALPAYAEATDPVIELRQYKIVHGRRSDFVALFDREFVDPQEQLGMRLVGQFEDMDDPDRFTWVREFPTIARRAALLSTFYGGPAWQAHRGEANPMLDDNDNVLLLKPSAPGKGFGAIERRPNAHRERATVVATIHYLWKAPAEGFAPFFETHGRPVLERAGLPVLGSYVAETRPNDFPRLPVRQGEKVFVWFARVDHLSRYERAMAVLRGRAGSIRGSQALIPEYEERPAQVLHLRPTPRSRLSGDAA
jgi:hypothetical protein